MGGTLASRKRAKRPRPSALARAPRMLEQTLHARRGNHAGNSSVSLNDERAFRAMQQMAECIPAPPEARPIPPKFELRALTTPSYAELQEATAMLADAFDEYPLFR